MASDDILKKAKALLGNSQPKVLGTAETKALPGRTAEALKSSGLDTYVAFDTTGSMDSYISVVKNNIEEVTNKLLDGSFDLRLSMNGIGDHCDGRNWIQMYELSSNPAEVQGSIEDIVMTSGGDEPEAYECFALQMAQRIPKDSAGRKRAIVLIGDSVPHGMIDGSCVKGVDYQDAFKAMKTVCDGFYLVGCNEQMYAQQRKLIEKNSSKEKFIPLGDMVDVLPALLIALAKKSQSEKALNEYLTQLSPGTARKIYGLLGSGNNG
ncbi:MAG: hypothetical protein Q8R47_06395 [Nanoarchaeota archaeon]|nr:hypothetical protein [Nanoarchaeota archaeon]